MSHIRYGVLKGDRRSQELLIVLALSLLALVTRAYAIWEWPITGDEYFTIARAEERAAGLIGSAYYALVLVSQGVFGATKWSARLPSVILGVLSIPAFYIMCRVIFNRQAATVGSLFIILSEWHLYHSQSARFYSGVFFFGAISYLSYYSAIRKESYIYLGIFFVSSILAIFFHATAVFILISCGTHALFLSVNRKIREGWDNSIKIPEAYILLCSLIGLIISPRLIQMIIEWGINYRGISIDGVRTMLGVVENMGVVIFVSAVLGLLYLRFQDKDKFHLVLFLVIVPIFSIFVFSIILPPARPRYLFYSLPVLFALSSFLSADALQEARSKILKNSISIIIISVLSVSFISYYSGRMSLDIRDPIQFVETKYIKGDEVIVFGPSAMYNFNDGVEVNVVRSKSVWRGQLLPVANKEGRTWIIVDTYRTAPIRSDLETWLMENASLRWRKKETRFDYTQRGYEVWLEE